MLFYWTLNDKLLVATDGKVKQFKIREFNKIATDLKIWPTTLLIIFHIKQSQE